MSVPNGRNRLLFTTSFADTRLLLIEYALYTSKYFTRPAVPHPSMKPSLYSRMLLGHG